MPLTLHCSTFVEQEQLRLSISVLLALAYRVALNFAVLILPFLRLFLRSVLRKQILPARKTSLFPFQNHSSSVLTKEIQMKCKFLWFAYI